MKPGHILGELWLHTLIKKYISIFFRIPTFTFHPKHTMDKIISKIRI